MRVLLAPTGLEPLSPSRVAAVLARGWASAAPRDDVVRRPMAAGGSGTLEALGALRGADRTPVVVAGVGTVPVVRLAGSAWLESATVAGDGAGSSRPLGLVLRHLLDGGAERVVVGLGSAQTRDAGFGLLAGLGMGGVHGRAAAGPDALAELTPDDMARLRELRERYQGARLVAAYDDDLPLVGLGGLSAQLSDDPLTGQQREQAVAHAVRLAVAAAADSSRTDLLSGMPTVSRLASAAGAGAGGGVGFALGLLGAELVPGPDVVAQAVGLDAELAVADLAVLAVPRVDGHVLHAGVVPAVTRRAAEHGVPVIVLARESLVARRALAAAGLTGCYLTTAVVGTASSVTATTEDVLARLAERVARTWSRP